MPQEARQIHRVSKYRKHAKALSIRISQNIGEWDERDAAVGGKKDGFIYHGVEGIPITKSRKMMKDEQRELLAMYISIYRERDLYLYTYIYLSIMEKKGGFRPEYERECWVSGISGQQRCSGHLYSPGNRLSWLLQVDLRACWVCVRVCVCKYVWGLPSSIWTETTAVIHFSC